MLFAAFSLHIDNDERGSLWRKLDCPFSVHGNLRKMYHLFFTETRGPGSSSCRRNIFAACLRFDLFQKSRDIFLLKADVEIGYVIVQGFPLQGDIAAQSVAYAERDRFVLVAADKSFALSSARRNLTALSGLEPANSRVDATIVDGISVSVLSGVQQHCKSVALSLDALSGG